MPLGDWGCDELIFVKQPVLSNQIVKHSFLDPLHGVAELVSRWKGTEVPVPLADAPYGGRKLSQIGISSIQQQIAALPIDPAKIESTNCFDDSSRRGAGDGGVVQVRDSDGMYRRGIALALGCWRGQKAPGIIGRTRRLPGI